MSLHFKSTVVVKTFSTILSSYTKHRNFVKWSTHYPNNFRSFHTFITVPKPSVITATGGSLESQSRTRTDGCAQHMMGGVNLSAGCTGSILYRSYAKWIKAYVPEVPRDRFMGLDPKAPKPGFGKVKELADADESVKKLFSLEYGDQTDIREYRLQAAMETVQVDPTDTDSLPVQIARMTVHLRDLAQQLPYNRKNKDMKSKLLKLISQRKELLGKLRTKDYKLFEKICKDFDISYVPPPRYKREHSRRQLKQILVKQKAFQDRRKALKEYLHSQNEKKLNEIVLLKKELGKEMTEEEEARLVSLERESS